MLTAAASCQPMPGPRRGRLARRQARYRLLRPLPGLLPPAPGRWPWLHTVLLAIGSDTALYAALGLMALVTVVFAVTVRREVRRPAGEGLTVRARTKVTVAAVALCAMVQLRHQPRRDRVKAPGGRRGAGQRAGGDRVHQGGPHRPGRARRRTRTSRR